MNNELYHHGIKGQKWGVRRFQNPDGSYTIEGKQRYYLNEGRHGIVGAGIKLNNKKIIKEQNKIETYEELNRHASSDDEKKYYMNKINNAKRLIDAASSMNRGLRTISPQANTLATAAMFVAPYGYIAAPSITYGYATYKGAKMSRK